MLLLDITRERLVWRYSSWRNPIRSESELSMGMEEDSRTGGAEEEEKEERRRVPSQ
jgi:hypothetical protein